MWVIILIIAVVILVVLKIKSEAEEQASALAELLSIDPKMNPTTKGSYLGWALGVSQDNKAVYINNKGTIVEIPFSQLTRINIEMEPVKSGVYTEHSFCDLIIHYTGGEKRFYTTKGDADSVCKALMSIIESNVHSHNSVLNKTTDETVKTIDVVKEYTLMTADQKGNIRKLLRALCVGIGATLILVAVIVFLVGGVDSLGSGELSSMMCNRCSGSGRWSGEKCPTCDGFGQILYNENGRNIMGTPALWIAIIGIGLVALGLLLKRKPSYRAGEHGTNDQANDEFTINVSHESAKIAGDKWICGHCGTSNSLNYSQCKKCGKYKS